MDPNVQKYLADKYQLGLSDEEKQVLSGSEERAANVGLGQGIMEAANSLSSAVVGKEPRQLFAENSANASSDRVREYIMNKLNERRGVAKMEQEQAFKDQGNTKSDKQFAEKMGLDRQKLELERQKLAQDTTAKKQTEKEAKNLKPTDIAAVNEGQDAMNLLGNLEGKMKGQTNNMGPVLGRLKTWNPYDTEAQVLQSDVKATAQMIGKYLEGGVLRAEDVPKYEAMLPTMKDKPEVAQGKIENVRKLLQMKQESRLGALEAQGYSVAGFKNQSPVMSVADSPTSKDSGGLVPTAYADDGKVKIQSPDGEIRVVDKSAAKKYIDKGGKVVQ